MALGLFAAVSARWSKRAVKRRKNELSRRFDRRFDSTVAYGPFRGLKLSPDSWWGASDRAAMLFGIYEQEVLRSIFDAPAARRVFIDIGAADGYYATGVLTSGRFDRAVCFEAAETGRAVIRGNAERNGVADRLEILGAADAAALAALPPDELASAVVLMDIEGAEFDLLVRRALEALRRAVVIVELHPFNVADGAGRLAALRKNAADFFTVSIFTTGARDLSMFPELAALPDIDRWLVCGESRPCLMSWLRLDPK